MPLSQHVCGKKVEFIGLFYICYWYKWYPEGFNKAINYRIDENNTIKILSAPYFIATKFEAFKSRGDGDGRTSQDFEDIIYIFENRKAIWDEMKDCSTEIKEYLLHEISQLKNNPYMFEWIDCHVQNGFPPASYFIVEEIEKFLS